MKEEKESLQVRFAKYLEEFCKLRISSVADAEKYSKEGSLIWYSSIPEDKDCYSPVRLKDDTDLNLWLSVKQQVFPKFPHPSEVIEPWCEIIKLEKATAEPPKLVESIYLPAVGNELEEGDESILHHISDHPEILREYNNYLERRWRPWSLEYRRKEKIQKVYAELFNILKKVQKMGEAYELVVGIGCLSWSPEIKGKRTPNVRRHIFEAKAEISFDSEAKELKVLCHEGGPQFSIADDMLPPDVRPDISNYEVTKALLDDLGEDIWDQPRMFSILSKWATVLHPDAQFSDDKESPPLNLSKPRINFAPAIILRKRNLYGVKKFYSELVKKIKEAESKTDQNPFCWNWLCNDLDDSVGGSKKGDGLPVDPGTQSSGGVDSNTQLADEEIFFPLPANDAQKKIIKVFKRRRGVLVQGPPGTGKSHTIVNLICHLLAEGKKILITAETPRALKVLKAKLDTDVPEVAPICVNALGNSVDEKSELERSVNKIVEKHSDWDPDRNDSIISRKRNELDKVRRKLTEKQKELISLREDETLSHTLGDGEYKGSGVAIANRVAGERSSFGWLDLPLNAAHNPPLSNQETTNWLRILAQRSSEDFSGADRKFIPSTELLAPESFASSVNEAGSIEAKLAELIAFKEHAFYSSVRKASPETLEKLVSEISEIESTQATLSSQNAPWIDQVIGDCFNGRFGIWEERLSRTLSTLQSVERTISKAVSSKIEGLEGLSTVTVSADAKVVARHLLAGRGWGFFGFRSSAVKGRLYLKKQVRLDGLPADNAQVLSDLADCLDGRNKIDDLMRLWGWGKPNDYGIAKRNLDSSVQNLRIIKSWYQKVQEVEKIFRNMTPPVSQINWAGGDGSGILQLIDFCLLEKKQEDTLSLVMKQKAKLAEIANLHDASHLCGELLNSTVSKNISTYSAAYDALIELEKIASDKIEKQRVEKILGENVSELVENVLADCSNPLWAERLEDFESAWRWSHADNWLKKRVDESYQKDLDKDWNSLRRNEAKIIAEIASLKAWGHFFERLDNTQSTALKAWQEVQRKMPKNVKTNKAELLRREARKHLQTCRESIPAWIMPRYMVADLFPPEPELFDAIIVDEASQLDIGGLFLFYLAKKVIVVGDNMQISPSGVGVNSDHIIGLKQQYLKDFKYNSAMSVDSSIYDNAKIRFDNPIVLREHFRCVPEIIQFSNRFCYAPYGSSLDPIRAYSPSRLQPVVNRFVPEGYREGTSTNAYNRPEAEAMVKQIVACLNDEKYNGKSMGVISLQGSTQAELIQRILLQYVSLEIIEEREIICGNAYAFQGDERDVIFLSMVAAPNEKIGVMSKDNAMYMQRFNVAASRARDQMVLFHSVQPEHLSSKCLRRELINYFLNPEVPQLSVGDEKCNNFELEVLTEIKNRGFFVRAQVGVGDIHNHNYRIDLVVEGMGGRLAVECDGDEWHGPEQYEYDIGRQRDLERVGWEFVRIRGSDFYRDKDEALKDLWDELEKRNIKPGGVDLTTSYSLPSVSEEIKSKFEQEDLTYESVIETDDQVPNPGSGLSETQDSITVAKTAEIADIIGVSEVSSGAGTIQEYTKYIGEGFKDPRDCSKTEIINGLVAIVEAEGPILVKRVYDIFLRSAGIKRLGGQLKNILNEAMETALSRGNVSVDDEKGTSELISMIVRLNDSEEIVVRKRGDRELDEIPLREIRALAEKVLPKPISLNDATYKEILSFYKITRLTSHAKEILGNALGSN